MAIGPVQLLVAGFRQPDFQGEIRQELDRLRDNDLVRVIDALAVSKDADGDVQVLHESQLSDDEQAAFGALVGGLIGLGVAGEEGFELGAERGAEAVADRDGVFSEETAWDVLEEIPPDTAGLLVLLEHRWAIPVRDAIARAGGFRLRPPAAVWPGGPPAASPAATDRPPAQPALRQASLGDLAWVKPGSSPLDGNASIPHSWNGPTWNGPRAAPEGNGDGSDGDADRWAVAARRRRRAARGRDLAL